MMQSEFELLENLLVASGKSKDKNAYGKTSDVILKTLKDKGIVPFGCYLVTAIALIESKAGRDPCARCNLDRGICGGRENQRT